MAKKTKISSMTGFARASGGNGTYSWNWEAKSVNGKGLDVRCRLPQGSEELEIEARKRTGKYFKRGNINLALTVQETDKKTQFQVNRILLDQLVETATEIQTKSGQIGPPSLDGLLSVRGVIETVEDEDDETAKAERNVKILEDLIVLLDGLKSGRAEEGERIGQVLNDQLIRIESLCGDAERLAEMQPETLKEKLRAQIAELLENIPALPEERLAQEAAVLMTKADVREELDRLKAHLDAARQLMGDGGVIGRKLDFLCQEFNREANTICSKAADVDLSRIGLDLKAVIEQFREQVQNIE